MDRPSKHNSSSYKDAYKNMRQPSLKQVLPDFRTKPARKVSKRFRNIALK